MKHTDKLKESGADDTTGILGHYRADVKREDREDREGDAMQMKQTGTWRRTSS